MKEPTSELNLAVIVAISVGVLMAFFFGFIWPALNHNFEKTSNCSKATCNCEAEIVEANDGYCACKVIKESDFTGEPCNSMDDEGCFPCVFKG